MTNMKNKYLFTFLLFYLFTFSPVHAQRIMTLEACVDAARKGNVTAMDAQNDILMAKEQQKYARSK